MAEYNFDAFRTVHECRLCDSRNLDEVLYLGDTPLANELDGTELFPLKVNRCGSCGHHQLSIAVSPERLWGPNYPYQSGTSPVFRKHLEALADEVAALKPGGRVLEIASNDGTLVKMLAARGCVVRGVDPSGPFDEGDGYKLFPQPWPGDSFLFPASGMGKESSGADVIIALNVFAHVDDLHGFTAAVKEALAPDGVFILEVGHFPDVVEDGKFDTIYHEHMSYHTSDPLVGFFERHGLCIMRMEHVQSQGGSKRYYVEHLCGAAIREQFDAPDVTRLQTAIDSRALALRAYLNACFSTDQMVCIYGAPAKLTTLLYATGLERMPFNCVGDDNPRKVGRTTPGNHIPIVSVEDMLARKPDAIVVAAWNFFDDIRDKLRRLGYAGDIISPMHRGSE